MLNKIKSQYILRKILSFNDEIINLKIIKYNKELQKKLGVNIESYKNFRKIEIEIFPGKDKIKEIQEDFIILRQKKNFKFINYNIRDKPYFHIYFDDNDKEEKRNSINIDEDISKIKIIIDYQVKSIMELFYEISYMKKIKFIRFDRNDFCRFTHMFFASLFLANIELSELKTENATNMNGMFRDCSSLISLDLSNFKTCKVKDMSNLFKGCHSLKYLDLSSFDTSNVKHMTGMFSDCSKLEIIKLKNFNTSNVIDMKEMFYCCSSLSDIDISHFILKNVKSMKGMFSGIGNELKTKIKQQNPGLKDEAFIEYK